jgi:excinuclease ABC subunit C
MTLRDRIKTIEKSQIKSGIDLATNEDIDIFAITASNKKAVVVRMFLRDGKLASSSHDFLKVNNFDENFDFDYNEAYKRAIINYYDNEIPLLPKEILTGIELEDVEELEDFLQTRFSKKIKVIKP